MKHQGTGETVEKKDIPKWKGTPQGSGPFQHTACGANVKPKQIAATKRSVNCQSCRRTRVWREA